MRDVAVLIAVVAIACESRPQAQVWGKVESLVRLDDKAYRLTVRQFWAAPAASEQLTIRYLGDLPPHVCPGGLVYVEGRAHGAELEASLLTATPDTRYDGGCWKYRCAQAKPPECQRADSAIK